MGVVASKPAQDWHDPVVVVIATCGKDRVDFLLNRALASVKKQINEIDRVVVVSDNDKEAETLSQDMIRSCFQGADEDKVFLLHNSRTRRVSGTGAWNTGIVEAFKVYGKKCWVAILDDDDEWADNHVRACLDASERSGDDCCKWVVSGIIRRRSNGEDHTEPIPLKKPRAQDFFTTNPGIQGSNLFVKCGALVEAGMFDERLPSTTDRDLCISLSDLLQADPDSAFASTETYTVIHHAGTHDRVSTRGSPAKIEGLKMFYYKHAPRMSAAQRAAFKRRAMERFDCNESEFLAMEAPHDDQPKAETGPLLSWSGDKLKLNRGSEALLSSLETSEAKEKKDVIFGIITGDMHRINPLLKDLGRASESSRCDFRAFVVVFANNDDRSFPGLVRDALKEQGLRAYVIDGSNSVVWDILSRCNSFTSKDKVNIPLPICQSRTVLQVFISKLARELRGVNAVVILDDDKRLPMGWSPFLADGNRAVADIQIGRDLRTPPNPSLLSLRTNLRDIVYAFDLQHLKSEDSFIDGGDDEVDELFRFCQSIDVFEDKFDWYYDKSSSRTNHLETPVFSYGLDWTKGTPFNSQDMLRTLLKEILIGTPFARDVIPPESGLTLQRGGCLVLIKKDDTSFDVLAVEQDAPVITLAGDKTIHSRRSDSFWCKEIRKSTGKAIEVNSRLFVYHDNSFDRVPKASAMRNIMVQEVLGAVLCRDKDMQRVFKDKAVLELKLWLSRIQGLLRTLRSRPYCCGVVKRELIQPLEGITDEASWQKEVFDVVDREFDKLETFEPHPTDFTAPQATTLTKKELKDAGFQWNIPKRVSEAADVLKTGFGSSGEFVGLGHEGVVFLTNDFAYKVLDLVQQKDLPDPAALEKFGAMYEKGMSLPVIRSPFVCDGTKYRGGHGVAVLELLKWMRDKRVGCRNFTPDNLIIAGNGRRERLCLVDLGRDIFMAPVSPSFDGDFRYDAEFLDMCRRAFLCFRFGSYANSSDGLKVLKGWMRESSRSHGRIPQLEGFDLFMQALESFRGLESSPRHRLFERLNHHGVLRPILIGASTNNSREVQVIDESQDDSAIVNSIAGTIAGTIESLTQTRVGSFVLAVCIEHPLQVAGRNRRPIWFFRRHLKRLSTRLSYSIMEDDVQGIDYNSFVKCVDYHIFLLNVDSRRIKEPIEGIAGCHLMIKSCPMEHATILADVRRIVHTLERPSTFKCITLLVDWSISSGFLRQYSRCDDEDLEAYKKSIDFIQKERLVDCVIEFGNSVENVLQATGINQRWFGREGCSATHSTSKQQYASTLHGFEELQKLNRYTPDDIVLQCDADTIFHADPDIDGVKECLSLFSSDPRLLTFAFPILSKSPSAGMFDRNGKPFRFEVRCSFVHLERLMSMLPLSVSDARKAASDEFCINQGWWRILDDNIKDSNWRSCRGSIAGGTSWFFVHPQNSVKGEEGSHRMLAIADRIANSKPPCDTASPPSSSACKDINLARKAQQDRVDLVCRGEWLCERNEPFVVVAYGVDVSYGRALRFLASLKRQVGDGNAGKVGLIIVNDLPDFAPELVGVSRQDTNDRIDRAAKRAFGDNASFISIGKRMGKAYIKHAIEDVCGPDTSIITLVRLEGCFLGRNTLGVIWSHLCPEDPCHTFSAKAMKALREILRLNGNWEQECHACLVRGENVSTRSPCFSNSASFYDESVGPSVFRKDRFNGALASGSNIIEIGKIVDATQFVEGGLLYLQDNEWPNDSIRQISDRRGIGRSRSISCDECGALDCACDHRPASRIDNRGSWAPQNGVAANTPFPWRVASTILPCKELVAHLYVTEEIPEGDLSVQVVALVKGEKLNEAKTVQVRIHSECLTGDIFYSKKCDCGEQKSRFIEIMDKSSHAVLLYIKGHEGRGAGLFHKIKAYYTLDCKDKGSITHIEALIQEGCKDDERLYHAAVKFLRDYLEVRFDAILLYTNNPKKIASVEELYKETGLKTSRMGTIPTLENSQYLREKEELMGHTGLRQERT